MVEGGFVLVERGCLFGGLLGFSFKQGFNSHVS